MADVTMTFAERLILDGLGPHTRAHVVQLMARFPHLTLSSGRRSPARNRLVGGSPRSYHLKGRAADFTGHPSVLHAARRVVWDLRVGPGCTGPEEAITHDAGSGYHLHVAW